MYVDECLPAHPCYTILMSAIYQFFESFSDCNTTGVDPDQSMHMHSLSGFALVANSLWLVFP